MEVSTVKKLEMMLEYANLTEAGRETVKQAIDLLYQGNRNDRIKMVAERIEEMLKQLMAEYQTAEKPALHIMTREEIQGVKEETLVWLEVKLSGALFPIEIKGTNDSTIVYTDGSQDLLCDEGTLFRIWTGKPTEEERQSVPWQEEA